MIMRLWPSSLFARLMLIWLVGIFLVLAVSIAIFISERNRVWSEGFAREIAANADIIDNLSPEQRHRAFDERGRSRRGLLRLSLSLPENAQPVPDDHPMLPILREAMPERQPALYTYRLEEQRSVGQPALSYGFEEQRSSGFAPLVVSVKLADGSILSARMRHQYRVPTHPMSSHVSMMAGALLALVAGVGILTWICVRIATRPLSKLSAAARALGENPERPPLEPAGPTEVIQATKAFNQMQERITAHMHERTRILAAISHDLQTPITRLRLRAELIDDETLQTRIQSDLDAMQSLIREGLAYARSMEVTAPPQAIDLNGLLAALCGDATDMGWEVSVTGQSNAPFTGHPVALRRALWNLIENGVKFGKSVEIALSEATEMFHILIRDHGPGLPAEEMERVFEPFYRTESSRNRETGGTGLGLAITRNLLHVQRGNIRLGNHPEGGLLALVTLPRQH